MPAQDFYQSPFAPPPPPPQPTPATWEDIIRGHAEKEGVDPRLALSVAEIESSFKPDAVNPESGATGLFQLMPATAKRRGMKDINDPIENIQHGVGELKDLLAAHGNDVVLSLRRYNGSPRASEELTNDYVNKVLAAVEARREQAEAAAAEPPMPYGPLAGTPPPDPQAWLADRGLRPAPGRFPPPPPPGAAPEEGILGTMLESMDPNEAEGRQNIAGGIGGLGGSVVGGSIGGFFGGPGGALAGRRVGSAIGSGIGGGLEQMFVEETPLGGWIAEQTPGPTHKPPQLYPEGSTPWSRAFRAGTGQAASDVIGQGVMGIASAGIKRVVGSKVGQYAAEQLGNAKRSQVVQDMTAQLDQLRARAAELTQARNTNRVRVATETDAAVQAARDEAADLLRTTRREGVGNVRNAQGGLEEARQLATERMQGTQDFHAEEIARARAAAEAAVENATTAGDRQIAQRELDFINNQAGALVAEVPTGGKVVDLFNTEVKAARKQLGGAVDAASKAAKDVDLTDVQGAAEAIVREKLLPTRTTFPSQALPEAGAEAAAAAAKPKKLVETGMFGPDNKPIMREVVDETAAAAPKTFLDQLQQDIGEARFKELMKHKAMDLITRLANAKGTVSHYDAHLLKRELDDAIRDTFDETTKKDLQALTQHLTGRLREALADPAYDAATKAYYEAMPRWTEGLAEDIVKQARTEPAKFIQKIAVDDPNQARMLRQLLTEDAEAGGRALAEEAARKTGAAQKLEGEALEQWVKEAGDAGARGAVERGREALQEVQGAWIYRNVMEGGIEGLQDRLRALYRRPEFVKNFLDDPEAKAFLAQLQDHADAYAADIAEAAAKKKGAEKTGAAGVSAAERAKKGAVRTEQKATAREIREKTAQVGKAKVGKEAEVEAARVRARDSVREAERLKKEAVEANRVADAGERGDVAKDIREKTSEIRRTRVARTPDEIDFPTSTLGRNRPKGVLDSIPFGKLLRGPSDADMIRYLKYTPYNPTRFFGRLATATTARGAAAAAGMGVKALEAGIRPQDQDTPEAGRGGVHVTIRAKDK